ncbi:MAG: hypothetical protein PHW77_08155 [Eubacteriales bacterium]|nr:hypothetical protein [Eubacteriales bacterium]
MKRFIAVILILILSTLLLSGCSSSDGTDDPNKIESTEYGFAFYYDNGWTEDVADSGISFKSPSDAAGVSKARISINVNDTDVTDVTEYWSAYESSLMTSFGDYTLKKEFTGDESVMLDGIKAVRAEYTATVSVVLYRFALVLCINDGHIYNILLSSEEAVFDVYSPCINTITEDFDFTGSVPENESRDTSTGGRAESQNGEYYFNISEGWRIDRNDGMIAVKPADGGNATVSVMVFSLSDEKANYGVNDYWKEYEEELKSTYPGYAFTREYAENEPKLGGVVASRKEYSITIESVNYKYIQVICITKGYVYSVLFASNDDEYAKYCGEFDNIITEFRFS